MEAGVARVVTIPEEVPAATLYEFTDSPFCIKARICLNIKGIQYHRETVTLARLRALRRLNPLRKVPVLVDEKDVVCDSSRIAAYLDDRFPSPPLIPRDQAARAYCRLLEEWADEALYFIIGAFKWLNPQNWRATYLASREIAGARALAPLVAYAARAVNRRKYRVWGYTGASLPHFEERMCENLEWLSTLLAGKPHLLGSPITLADVAVFAQLRWMRRYSEKRLLHDFDVVRGWLDHLEADPRFATAV